MLQVLTRYRNKPPIRRPVGAVLGELSCPGEGSNSFEVCRLLVISAQLGPSLCET